MALFACVTCALPTRISILLPLRLRYRKGRAYRQAIDLCRLKFQNEVVPLEEEWGDYLVSQKQLDQAINHYIEGKRRVHHTSPRRCIIAHHSFIPSPRRFPCSSTSLPLSFSTSFSFLLPSSFDADSLRPSPYTHTYAYIPCLGAHRVAGCTEKAVKAAIAARQWQKAAHVVDLLDEKSGQEHVRALAEHYAAVHEYVSPLARHHECYTPTSLSLSLSSFPPLPTGSARPLLPRLSLLVPQCPNRHQHQSQRVLPHTLQNLC